MRPLFLVPGTHGGDWIDEDSPVRAHLIAAGFRTYLWPWSYRTGGVPSILDPNLTGDWEAGGLSGRFELYAMALHGLIDLDEVDVLTHSHGANPPIFQTVLPSINGFAPVPIRNLITICAPPRADMQPVYRRARATGMIGFHRAVYAYDWDFWARAGQAFDGSWGWQRDWHGADENIGLDGIGHATLLNDPTQFARLVDQLHMRA